MTRKPRPDGWGFLFLIEFIKSRNHTYCMAKKNYIIYADESDKRGRYYSNFFGGVLLLANDQQEISRILNNKKLSLGLKSEVKWQSTDASNVDRYSEFINLYFSFIKTSRLKTRIMFTHNIEVPLNLDKHHYDAQYFIMYYQFIKHAFGIAYCNPNNLDKVNITILPDKIPESKEKLDAFKNQLVQITERRPLKGRNITILKENISDVDSSKHVILQGLDLILGSMNSRLNDKLKDKPEGQRRRGKRTIAKEKLYKQINRNIRDIYPNFNVGVNTGTRNGNSDRWNDPYRHWRFTPKHHRIDISYSKKSTPEKPT